VDGAFDGAGSSAQSRCSDTRGAPISQEVLHDLEIQRLVSDEPLEPAVFLLQGL
jgi:hypothetical protein